MQHTQGYSDFKGKLYAQRVGVEILLAQKLRKRLVFVHMNQEIIADSFTLAVEYLLHTIVQTLNQISAAQGNHGFDFVFYGVVFFKIIIHVNDLDHRAQFAVCKLQHAARTARTDKVARVRPAIP